MFISKHFSTIKINVEGEYLFSQLPKKEGGGTGNRSI